MRNYLAAFLVSAALVPAAHAQDFSAALGTSGIGKPAVEVALADGGRGNHEWRGESRGDRGNGGNYGGGGFRSRGAGQPMAQPAPAPAPAQAPQARPQWNGGNQGWRGRGSADASPNQGSIPPSPARDRSWNRGRDALNTSPVPVQPQRRFEDRRARTDWDRNNNGRVDRNWDRNRNGVVDRSWDRNRDGSLDRRWDRNRDGNLDRRWDHNRNGTLDRRWDRNRDGHYDRRDNNRRDYGSWNRGWRNDNRYNWQHYRNQYRHYYQQPRYYNPYGYSYGYRRFGIGVYLDSLFYSSRFWISSPWQYRLPDPGYGMRWVRYYDDVLLVDMESGYVVDVIHDFFW